MEQTSFHAPRLFSQFRLGGLPTSAFSNLSSSLPEAISQAAACFRLHRLGHHSRLPALRSARPAHGSHAFRMRTGDRPRPAPRPHHRSGPTADGRPTLGRRRVTICKAGFFLRSDSHCKHRAVEMQAPPPARVPAHFQTPTATEHHDHGSSGAEHCKWQTAADVVADPGAAPT